MDFYLNEEQRMWQAAVHDFVAKEVGLTMDGYRSVAEYGITEWWPKEMFNKKFVRIIEPDSDVEISSFYYTLGKTINKVKRKR